MDHKIKIPRKRPEIQLYRPGMGKLLGKKTDEHVEEAEKMTSKKNEKEDIERKDVSSKNNNQNKKPDLQYYNPRSKNYYKKLIEDDIKYNNRIKRDKYKTNKTNITPSTSKKHIYDNKSKESSSDKHEFDARKITNSIQEQQKLSEKSEIKIGDNYKIANEIDNSKEKNHQCEQVDISCSKECVQKTIDNSEAVSDEKKNQKEIVLNEVRHNEVRHNEVRHNEVRHNEVRHNEVRHNENSKGYFKSNKNSKSEKTKPKRFPNKQDTNQLPPRFLKLQMQKMSLKEQKMQSNQQLKQGTAENSVNKEQQIVSNRGIIRLPPNTSNQIFTNNEAIQNLDFRDSHQVNMTLSKISVNSNKPCVAIRPTPHVTMQFNEQPEFNFISYSPSSSPDVSNINQFQYSFPYYHVQSRPFSPNSFQNSYPMTNPESELRLNFDLTKKPMKTMIEKNLTEALSEEKELQQLIGKSQDCDLTRFERQRFKIQLRYERIILTDLRLCAEKNIEQMLWKIVFYQFIELFRKHLEKCPNSETEKLSLQKIVDEATLFFENLLVKLQDTYYFNIETLLDNGYDRQAHNYEIIKLATISAQKIYLYLGDLARYKEQFFKASNFAKSRSYYLKAQKLSPKNGRPYNQLALLAMYEKRRLEAVYYYMRSLAASYPIQAARDNLLGIFDEVRKKYESIKRRRKQDQSGNFSMFNEEKQEISVNDEMLSNEIMEENKKEEIELDSLSAVDLNKRFILSFLNLHDKLFTKTGMETFIPTVNQMLLEFHCLLKRSPIPFSSERMLQLLGINMFSVFYTSLKDSNYEPDYRSLLQEHAIQVTFAMITLILQCATHVLNDFLKKEMQPNFVNDDLAELLPTIKIWTDWMSCQKHLWSPLPPSSSDFNTRCNEDIWSMFANFLTAFTNFDCKSVKLLPTRLEGCEAILLPEDSFLAGFYPLLGAPHCSQFVQPPYDKEKARACLRITVIQFFGDYLCGITEPYLKFDVEHKKFVSLVSSSINSLEKKKI